MIDWIRRSVLLCFILLFINIGFSQDSTFIKSMYAGSYIIVPKNKTWQIEKAFINGNDAYNIKISTSSFKNKYLEGDTIRLPYYVAEMELLSSNSTKSYKLYIKETK